MPQANINYSVTNMFHVKDHRNLFFCFTDVTVTNLWEQIITLRYLWMTKLKAILTPWNLAWWEQVRRSPVFAKQSKSSVMSDVEMRRNLSLSVSRDL